MTVEGQRYLEECRKVLREEQMDAVSMGLDFGLPVSDIQKVVKSLSLIHISEPTRH